MADDEPRAGKPPAASEPETPDEPDVVMWNPGPQVVIMCDGAPAGMAFLSMTSAISTWYERSTAHERWFDPQRHGIFEIYLGFSDYEPPQEGKARLYRGRGPGGLPKTIYNRLMPCADMPETVDRNAWVAQIARNHEALSAVGTRLGLPQPPPPPNPEDCMPYLRPFDEDEYWLG